MEDSWRLGEAYSIWKLRWKRHNLGSSPKLGSVCTDTLKSYGLFLSKSLQLNRQQLSLWSKSDVFVFLPDALGSRNLLKLYAGCTFISGVVLVVGNNRYFQIILAKEAPMRKWFRESSLFQLIGVASFFCSSVWVVVYRKTGEEKKQGRAVFGPNDSIYIELRNILKWNNFLPQERW